LEKSAFAEKNLKTAVADEQESQGIFSVDTKITLLIFQNRDCIGSEILYFCTNDIFFFEVKGAYFCRFLSADIVLPVCLPIAEGCFVKKIWNCNAIILNSLNLTLKISLRFLI
jgi:hypothetical protein